MSEEGGEAPAAAEVVSSVGEKEKYDRMWAMFTHLSALAGLVGVPFGSVIGPLLIWQIKKEEIPSIEVHGKNALNFQISMLIYFTVLMVVGALLVVILIGFLFLLMAGVVVIADLVYTVIGGLRANEGEEYEYPFTIQFLK